MSLSDKLAALSRLCGAKPDSITVRRKWKFLGLVPVSIFDSDLWVAADEGDWWRVMLSPQCGPIIGADFRKDGGACPVDGDFIAWKRDGGEWGLAGSADAIAIRDRIESSIELAYRQYVASLPTLN